MNLFAVPSIGENVKRLANNVFETILSDIQQFAETPMFEINLRTSIAILYHILDSPGAQVTHRNPFDFISAIHNILGKHALCTKDGGKLLSFAFDMIYASTKISGEEKKLRLAQISHCLFRLPSVRAEDHSCLSIDLSWERFLQLIQVYKYDALPFGDSLAESTLLERVVDALPPDHELFRRVAILRKFLTGESVNSAVVEAFVEILPETTTDLFYKAAAHLCQARSHGEIAGTLFAGFEQSTITVRRMDRIGQLSTAQTPLSRVD